MGLAERDPLAQLSLPPGFRFYPTDEELMVQYLCRKVAGHEFPLQIIGDIDLYKFDPWVLPSLAMFGEKEWYFFSPRDRKYPNGSRPNRVAGSGYWKATGTDKIITTQGRKVGIKKALVFYIGKAPKGTKTNWIMHEYRLSDPQRKNGSSKLDEWVLCRIYKKNGSASSTKQLPTISSPNCTSMSSPFTGGSGYGGSSPSSSSHIDSFLESMPDQLPDHDLPLKTDDKLDDLLKVGSGNFDWEALLGLTTTPELNSHTQQGRTGQSQQIQQSSTTRGNNNFPVTSLPPLRQVDDEVQSGIKNAHPVNNNNQFPQSSAGVIYPFGIIQYPNQSNGYGFRQ